MLYFAYSATLDPELLSSIAPNAKFLYIAHLPEAKLVFPTPDGRPSVRPAAGNTVWGAIFEVNAEGVGHDRKGRGRRKAGLPAATSGRWTGPATSTRSSRSATAASRPITRPIPSTWSRSSGVPVIGAFRPAGSRDWKTSAKTP